MITPIPNTMLAAMVHISPLRRPEIRNSGAQTRKRIDPAV